jgi:hypothetical protein
MKKKKKKRTALERINAAKAEREKRLRAEAEAYGRDIDADAAELFELDERDRHANSIDAMLAATQKKMGGSSHVMDDRDAPGVAGAAELSGEATVVAERRQEQRCDDARDRDVSRAAPRAVCSHARTRRRTPSPH